MDNFFINTSGDIVPVAPSEAAGAAQLGWVPASPKQVADFQLQEKYGTGTEALKAFGEHAASGATFGLSDLLERTAGVDPEAVRARESANPVASGLGTATGVGVGLFVPGSGPARIAKAGKGVFSAVTKSLPAAEGLAGRLLAKAAASGAGSAVEGAAYGLGQVVHEVALGDPNLTAQSALATVGLSSALGGVLGGAGGVLGHALGEGAKALPDWLAKLEGERNVKAAGGIQSDIARLVKQKGRPNLQAIGREGGELGLVSPLSTPESTAEKAQALLSKTGDDMGILLANADSKGKPANVFGMLAEARRDTLKPLARNPLQQDAAARFGSALDGYSQKFAATDGRATLTELHGMRREVSDALYGLRGNQDPFANSYKDALHDFRSLISDEINQGMDRAGVGASEWRALNRRYEVGSVFADLAEKGMNRAHGNNLVSPTELLSAVGGGATLGAVGGLASGAGAAFLRRHASGMLGAAARALREEIASGAVEGVANRSAEAIAAARAAGTDTLTAAASSAPEKVATLSLLERLNQAAAKKVENGVGIIVRGSPKAAAVGRGEAAAGIASAFGRSQDEARAQFSKRTEQIRALSGDPGTLQDKLTAQTDDWHEHAPQTAQALQIATARAVAFLTSKLPQTGKAGPLAADHVPGRAEISKFTRYYEAVQNPMGILKQAAAGTLTPEAVEAVATVYPELFDRMRAEAVSRLAGAKAVPYRSRLMLTMLLGQDMDGTTTPMALMRNRMVFAKPLAPPPPAKPGKLTLANRMQTPMQESAARRGSR